VSPMRAASAPALLPPVTVSATPAMTRNASAHIADGTLGGAALWRGEGPVSRSHRRRRADLDCPADLGPAARATAIRAGLARTARTRRRLGDRRQPALLWRDEAHRSRARLCRRDDRTG